MARRMIFNIKSGNKDDHSKNFSFLMNEKHQWRLAPAYDLTASAGINGEQTCMVNGKGCNITDADLIKTAATANIPETESKDMIEAVNAALFRHNILH
jgi:serine/threonine-protein kinase HipA